MLWAMWATGARLIGTMCARYEHQHLREAKQALHQAPHLMLCLMPCHRRYPLRPLQAPCVKSD